MAQSVNITELNLPQLEMLKNQLDQEVEFLSTSIAQLKVVQTKYVEAKDCLNVLKKNNEGKELLVPLTSSMYVPGKLHDVEHVLIDVGTGYYVEKVSGREHKNASLRGRVSVQNGLPLIHFDLADS